MVDLRPAARPSRPASDGVVNAADLIVERVSTTEELQRLGPAWTALVARVDDALPFATHEWAMAWWTHLRRETRWAHDSLEVHTVRTRAGETIAVAPMMLTHRPARGALRVRALQFFGADATSPRCAACWWRGRTRRRRCRRWPRT
jgi:hypothetical protein